jgi:hypothetical protein
MARKNRLDPLVKAVEMGRERVVQHYSTSLLDFARDVICCKEKVNLISEEVHGEMCRTLQNLYWGLLEKKVPNESIHGVLINVPRGCFKSTIATIAFPLWVLLQNRPDGNLYQPPTSFNGKDGRNQRINLAHETAAESQKYLGLIAHHLHKNEVLHSIYGEDVFWRKKTEGRWSGWELNTPWRDDYTAREANITTTSLRASIAGGHYDITVWDDIFTELTINEENGIQKVMDYYRRYIPVAHMPSLLVVVGTRKHDADLYGYIQEKEADKWHVIVEKAWREPEDIANGKREFFFPQKHNRESLIDIKERMGDEYFYTEYQNMPINPKNAKFKTEWFEDKFDFPLTKEGREAFLKDKTLYVLSDPAVADNKKACLSTIGAIAVDSRGHWWLIDAWGGKGVGDDPTEYISELFRMSTEYGPVMWTAVENVGFQRLIRWEAGRRSKESGVYLNWFPLEPGGRSKDARILGMRPLAQQGGIHLQPHHQHVLQEFLRYPKGKSRDFIDMISYVPDVATIPEGGLQGQEKPIEAPDETQKALVVARMARRGIVFPGTEAHRDDDRFDLY